jgi:hypothetical protein
VRHLHRGSAKRRRSKQRRAAERNAQPPAGPIPAPTMVTTRIGGKPTPGSAMEHMYSFSLKVQQ